MDPRRAAVERNAHFTRGPRFFREGDRLMFEFVIDATNTLGPRPANDGDKRTHSEAWREFERLDVPPPPEPDIAVVEYGPGQPAPKRAYRRKALVSESADQ